MSTTLPVTGNTPLTHPENRAFYPALDGLRALAFLMVFFYHYLALPWGWAGVDLFFVLSGFLITGILYDTRNDPHRLRNFYIRRTLRIFPLYYGVMLLSLLLWPVFHWQLGWSWLVWPAYLGNWVRLLPLQPAGSARALLAYFQWSGSLHGTPVLLYLGHFWTLCVEEQFYLVWPFVVFTLRDRHKLLWICALSVPVCLVARLVCAAVLPAWLLEQDPLVHLTPFRLDDLLLGGFAALILRGPSRAAALRWARRLLLPSLALLSLWAIAFGPRTLQRHGDPYPASTPTVGLTLIALFAALLIMTLLQPENRLTACFSWGPARWLGRLSYGAYVFHDILHAEYERLVLPLSGNHPAIRTLLAALVALGCTVLLAWVSFGFFETPFLNLKERYTRTSLAI